MSDINWGYSGQIEPFVTYTAEIITKNSASSIISLSDHNLYLFIAEKCTWGSSNYECLNGNNLLSSENTYQMRNWNNGSFTADYTLESEGQVTMAILYTENQRIETEYFRDPDFGTYVTTKNETEIDYL